MVAEGLANKYEPFVRQYDIVEEYISEGKQMRLQYVSNGINKNYKVVSLGRAVGQTLVESAAASRKENKPVIAWNVPMVASALLYAWDALLEKL